MSGAWRTAGVWILTAALVAGAGVLTAIKPGEHAVEVPFTVQAKIGAEGVARNIAVTVHEARFTSHVTGRPNGTGLDKDWSADGLWLVVDLDAAAVREQQSLLFATLEVDGMTFSASDRMQSFMNAGLVPGIAKSGRIAFELPASLHRGPAVLSFSTRPDNRLDSIVQVPVDLAHAGSAGSVEITEPTWSTR